MTSWLAPIPGLRRRACDHTYWLGDHLFPVSTTGVLAQGRSQVVRERLAAGRREWAPRGTAIHAALERFLLAGRPGLTGATADRSRTLQQVRHDPSLTAYLAWIVPLLIHPLWDAVEVIATEMPLCSLALNLAGTFDGAWQTPSGQRVLFDLKTQRRVEASAYCTRAQLGSYLAMATECGIAFDAAVTIWSRPGTVAIQRHGRQECLDAWQTVWAAYCRQQRPW